MKNHLLIAIVALLLILPFAFAEPLGDNLVMCYSADESVANQNTVPYNQNLTSNGAPGTRTGKVGANSYDAPDNDNTNYRYVATGNAIPDGETNLTICGWHNLDTADAGANQFYLSIGTAAANSMAATYVGVSPNNEIKFSDGDTDPVTGLNTAVGTWYHTCIVYNATGDSTQIYVNNVVRITHPQAITRGNDILMLGQYPGAASFGEFDGGIDELMVFNKTLSASEVNQIYNSTSGLSCAYVYANRTGGTPGTVNTITLSLTNNVTGAAIGSTTTISNLTGTLTFTYYNITSTGFCVSYTGNGTGSNCTTTGSGASTFFNVSTTQTVTGDITITNQTYQALLDLRAYRLFLNTSISTFNATNNKTANTTTNGVLLLKANNGTNIVRIDVAGNRTQNITCTVPTPLQTVSCNATGIHDNDYSFNATDIWNDVAIQNFSLIISNGTLGGTLYNISTTNGSINVSLLQGYTYFIQFTNPNGTYEYVNVSLAANTSNQHYEFQVLPAPSIDITIRDADTNALILENVTIQLINNATGQTNYTITGGFFSGQITVGTYTVKLESTNYSQSVYTVTINSGNVYFLTAYLQFAPNTVVMQFVDSISSSLVLPDTAVSQERVVNGSWQVISSKVTDITGRTSFRYADDTAYRFTAIKSGYGSKIFTLDPLLFSSYTINMERDTGLDSDQDFQSVYIGYDPHLFYDAQQNQMNITFSSPLGTFTSYSYTIRYPGGSKNGSGTNIVGETFTVNFNITGAGYADRVNTTLIYDTSIGPSRGFNYSNGIIVNPGSSTFIANQDNTYGLGLLERLLIGTIIVLVFAGIATLIGGPTAGLVLILLHFGIMVKIGFWPWWSIAISLLVGLAVLAGRTD